MDNFDLRKYLVENKVTTNSRMLTEAAEVPAWLKGKLEDVHVKPGQGSIFAKSVDEILKLAQSLLDKTNPEELDRVANSTGTLTMNVPGAGYNLVLPIEQAKKLPGAQESEVEKQEGPNKVKVPAITTSAPLSQFSTNELTVIVRPKKDESGAVIPNEYIVLSVFPGDPDIPRASEWNGKYAVIIPNAKTQTNEIGFKNRPLREVLDDINDAQTAAALIKNQLDAYAEGRHDYGSGYQMEEKLEKLLKVVGKKLNIPETSFKIKDNYNTSYNEYDEGTTEGSITLNGHTVLTYSSHSDGYGFNAEVDERAIQAELAKLIKPTA
jgi:hypothetical protein